MTITYIYAVLAIVHFLAFALVIAKYARGRIEISIGLLASALVATVWPISWLAGRSFFSHL